MSPFRLPPFRLRLGAGPAGDRPYVMLQGTSSTMAKGSVKDRVTAMARDVLGPEMKASGFRRSGRVFWRNGPDVCHVATIEMDRWGSSDASSFGVSLGVFWHRVEAILGNPSAGKMPPSENRCTFRIHLGRVISMPPKPEWRVTHTSNYEALAAEVWHDLKEYGIAWFDYRSDLRRTLEWKRYATPEGDGTYSMQELVLPSAQAVFKVMLGKKASAVADLKRFAKNGYADDASKLARKLRLPTREIIRASGEPAGTRRGGMRKGGARKGDIHLFSK